MPPKDELAVDKEDIKDINTKLTQVCVDIAVIKTTLKGRSRPCSDFLTLEKRVNVLYVEKEKTARTIKDHAIKLGYDLVKLGIVGYLGYAFATIN